MTCCCALSDNDNLLIRIFSPITNTVKTKLSVLENKMV